MGASIGNKRYFLVVLVTCFCFGCQLNILQTRPNIEDIIVSLKSDDPDEREAAAEDLVTLAEQGLSVEEGIIALRAAAHEFPPREHEWQDSSVDLIGAAAWDPQPEYASVIAELFPDYSDRAKSRALNLLVEIPDREAAIVYMDIVRSYARDLTEKNPAEWYWWPLPSECRHEGIFFPELLDYTDVSAIEYQVYLLCLRCFEDGVFSSTDFPYSNQILESYRGYKEELMQAQKNEGIDWMWEDDYQLWRDSGALLLDLLGYFPTPEVRQELREALDYTDPRLKHFAVISLLRQGEDVEQEHVHSVASSAEMRNWLYDRLQELGQESLFPNEFKTQEAFAESNMVDWLVYPTELGRVPDEIELMEIVTIDSETSDGMLEYYIFRFRTYPPHWASEDGWMAGIAGPFLQKDAPSTVSYGDTFSAFKSWDSMSAEEHVYDMLGILESTVIEYP